MRQKRVIVTTGKILVKSMSDGGVFALSAQAKGSLRSGGMQDGLGCETGAEGLDRRRRAR